VTDVTDATARTESADRKDRLASITGKIPDWWPRWDGEAVALVASGPTAKKSNLAALRDRARVIAINESYQLCLWADALYACDGNWWELKKGAPEFNGLKISQEAEACKRYPDIKKVEVDRYSNELKLHQWGCIGAGGNGGFQALNLAVQFGCDRVMLIGYDMRVDLGEHWHKRTKCRCRIRTRMTICRDGGWQSTARRRF
jgi:hypothetical protein